MDLYNSFLFLVLGLLAVSRPSESQVGGRPGGIKPIELVPLKSNAEVPENTVKENFFSRNNKNKGTSETELLYEPSTSNAFSHSDPLRTVEGVNHYGGRVSDRNADLGESASIERKDQSFTNKVTNWKSFGKKTEPEDTLELIDDATQERPITFYDSEGKPVNCIMETKMTKNGREHSIRLAEGVEEEYLSHGVKSVTLYPESGLQGSELIFPIKQSNRPREAVRGIMKYVKSKYDAITGKNSDVRYEPVENPHDANSPDNTGTIPKENENSVSKILENLLNWRSQSQSGSSLTPMGKYMKSTM